MESAHLSKEMSVGIRSMQRKQFGDKPMLQAHELEDHNVFNVIKTDYKTQQRQKEIINVISDMSAQISQSLAKCMQSFIS